VDAQQLTGEPPCCRAGLACRGQDQVDVPFQTRPALRVPPISKTLSNDYALWPVARWPLGSVHRSPGAAWSALA
jgi:hypothetical protein